MSGPSASRRREASDVTIGAGYEGRAASSWKSDARPCSTSADPARRRHRAAVTKVRSKASELSGVDRISDRLYRRRPRRHALCQCQRLERRRFASARRRGLHQRDGDRFSVHAADRRSHERLHREGSHASEPRSANASAGSRFRPTPFEPFDIAGKIVIAFYNLRTQRFAHGVRFLHLPQKTEDEIQRFIHLYQLKQLRERAEREAAL